MSKIEVKYKVLLTWGEVEVTRDEYFKMMESYDLPFHDVEWFDYEEDMRHAKRAMLRLLKS